MTLPALPAQGSTAWYAHYTALHNGVAGAAKVGDVPRLSGPLGGWKAKLATAPATAKVVFLGDSTSDPATHASTMYRRLLGVHAQQGEALHGLGSADFYTDGVGNGTTTFTSATANFTTGDVGRLIHGKGFPSATIITARSSATSVTVLGTIPTGTGLPFWIGRRVIGGGNNGKPLVDWMASPSDVASPYNRDKLVADAPDLTVASWLINDVREGLLGTTVDAIVTAGATRLQAFIDWHRGALPNTDILLRMPNPFLTANVSSYNFVKDAPAGNINPAGLAQIYSTALRRIYLSFVGRYPNVDVLDTQAEVFGTRSVASHPLMVDQLHPSTYTQTDVGLLSPIGGGYTAVADAIARRIGFDRNAFPPDAAQRVRHEFLVYEGPVAGTIRLRSRDVHVPAPQAPVFRTDSLYVNGLDGPIALTAANIERVYNTTILQISSLGTTDFAPYVGQTAVIAGNHPNTTGERQQVYVDLPSIAAGATTAVDIALTGASPGNAGHATAILATPGNGFSTGSLRLQSVYPYSTDQVRLVVHNPTAGAIDAAGESWTFWILR